MFEGPREDRSDHPWLLQSRLLEATVPRHRKTRRRTGRGVATPDLDLQPLVARTLKFLENSPKGASRVDILTAMNLQPSAWPTLRAALEQTGDVIVIGRGPGLRHVHSSFAKDLPVGPTTTQQAESRERITQARHALERMLQEMGTIDSSQAQEATGLKADPARRLLLDLVGQGLVERTGQKRSTRYHWVG